MLFVDPVSDYYPKEVSGLWKEHGHSGRPDVHSAGGRAASFECGATGEFFISIEENTKVISSARYETSGCGFAVAAGELLARLVEGKALTELGGFAALAETALGALDADRRSRSHCTEVQLEALKLALATWREAEISEWKGEDPLICSCFGVPESEIERLASSGEAADVDDVGRECGAGTGCGSCRMLITEILEGFVDQL